MQCSNCNIPYSKISPRCRKSSLTFSFFLNVLKPYCKIEALNKVRKLWIAAGRRRVPGRRNQATQDARFACCETREDKSGSPIEKRGLEDECEQLHHSTEALKHPDLSTRTSALRLGPSTPACNQEKATHHNQYRPDNYEMAHTFSNSMVS